MNILWILTTQWRAQACGYAGDPNVRTPHLDHLARCARNFSQAITPHPFGPFARAALLTGTRSPENGVRDYYDPLPENAETIAHRFNRRGYETAFFGKWHLGKRDARDPLVGREHAQIKIPKSRRGGFAFWEGFESGFQLNDPWLHGVRLPEPTQFSGYQSDVVFSRAGGWIKEVSARKPWFCVASVEPPHPPYQGAPKGVHPFERGAIQLAKNVPRDPKISERAERELRGYYEHIEATDAALGRLLACIDRRTTAVIFVSVHGDMHGGHGLFRKGWPYEESIRVPLLVQVPGLPSAEDRAAISLLDLSGLTEQLSITNQWPHFERTEADVSMPSVVKLPDQCDRVWSGVRSPRRKMILNPDGSPWLFFDLENDPEEMVNLAADPSRQAELDEWSKKVRR